MKGRVAWSLVLALVAACPDSVTTPVDTGATGTPATPAATPRWGEQVWVFHINGGPYAAHIQLVAIDDRAGRAGPVFRPIASRGWDGAPTNDFAGFQATPDGPTGLRWSLRHPRGQTLGLAFAVTGDTAIGALTLADGTRYPLVGVRFGATVLNLLAPPLGRMGADSQPAVVIRLDDAPGTDRDFLRRLKARGLSAELAVPTRFLGRPNRLTWEDLQSWRGQGMAVVMHSRYHLSTSADAQYFISEIVGGFAETAAHGFASHVFVQPGTWRDSINFDSPAKLQTWRGALLRTFTTVSECYAYPSSLPRADSHALGLSHVTISDGIVEAAIRGFWAVALRPNHATVFLVHTANLKTADQLDWFLDEVAAARARGAVRVVATSEELFVVRTR